MMLPHSRVSGDWGLISELKLMSFANDVGGGSGLRDWGLAFSFQGSGFSVRDSVSGI